MTPATAERDPLAVLLLDLAMGGSTDAKLAWLHGLDPCGCPASETPEHDGWAVAVVRPDGIRYATVAYCHTGKHRVEMPAELA